MDDLPCRPMEPLSLNQRLIYVIGCPGAGKGTLCSKLAAKCSCAHISVGNELRKYSQNCEQEKDIVTECVRSAKLAPKERLAEILSGCMQRQRDQGYTSFIIDGFPRHTEQISYMQDMLGVPDLVIFMDCPKEIAKERVLTRNIASREDNEDIFEKRFAEFCANNPDIVNRFEAEGKLRKVDTRYAEEVSFKCVFAALRDSSEK